jgi:hypothetical protein
MSGRRARRERPCQRGIAWIAQMLLLLLVADFAAAEEAGSSYSELETRTIAEALEQLKTKLEPEPAGKRIRKIHVVVREVFDSADPVPQWVNVFHFTSRPRVIQRELLFEEGELYDEERLEESQRRLRSVRQLSLVLILPVESGVPGEVDVLVLTRDVWSLRMNSDFQFEGSNLRYLLVNPSEENLLGTHVAVGGLFILTRASTSTGLVLTYPRVLGSRLFASTSASLTFDRETNQQEGSFGNLFLGQPLYSIDAKWAWAFGAQWRNDVFRAYLGNQRAFFDAPSTEEAERLPWQYRGVIASSAAEVVRSFGKLDKLDLSFGLEGTRSEFRTYRVEGFDPDLVEEFRTLAVPIGVRRISPVLQLRSYSHRYAQLLEVNTLALQEDLRLGPEVVLRVYAASERLGSSRDLFGLYTATGYTLPLADGLVRGVQSSRLSFSPFGRTDVAHELATYIVTPHLRLGRLHHALWLSARPQNYSNARAYIGGDNRLRGYPSGAFMGTNAAASNLELRTRSVDVFSAQVGAVTFYDVAGAFEAFRSPVLGHSVGAGLRVLFPQLDRTVLRADLGFPVGADRRGPFPGALFVAWGQGFGTPAVASPSLVSGFF